MKNVAVSVFVVLAVVSLCSGQWLERIVPIGDTLGGLDLQGGIVVNPVTGNAYIQAGPTQVFSPATAEKVRSIAASGPAVFCPPSGKGYLIGDSTVILDATADTVVGKVRLPFSPFASAYSSASNRLYLGGLVGNGLLVFDPDGDSVLTTLEAGNSVFALLWDSVRNRLYAGDDSGSVSVVDCSADSVVARVRLAFTEVVALALSTSGKLFCVGVPDTTGGSRVVVVSADSLVPIGDVAAMRLPDLVVYNPVTDRLWCSCGDSLLIIDCRADTVRRRLSMAVGPVAVNTVSGEVYLGMDQPGLVSVMDTSDEIAHHIFVDAVPGTRAGALAFSHDRNQVYGAMTADVAFIIDAAANTVAGLVNYAVYSPRQLVHNPVGNKLYMLCPLSDAVVVHDSTLAPARFIYGGATNTNAVAVMSDTLNRMYVADFAELRVIDCDSDDLLFTAHLVGITHPRSVLVPGLNKLYVFAGAGSGDNVYCYDELGEKVDTVAVLTNAVSCAAFDPRSGRVFFVCRDFPNVRILDPVRDSVVKTLDLLAGSAAARMVVFPALGRLYLTDQDSDLMYTIDVLSDSVIDTTALPWDIDTLFLDAGLGKLFMCGRDRPNVLAYDCNQRTMDYVFAATFQDAGLMNDRNHKLYLRHGAVVDCRGDSVVTRLDSIDSRCMAWDVSNNRVFAATPRALYVYRDDPPGVAERQIEARGPKLAVIGNPARNAVRLRLQIPSGQTGTLAVHDATGRLVHLSSGLRTQSYRLDPASMPAGVYFVSLRAGETEEVSKVVIQR